MTDTRRKINLLDFHRDTSGTYFGYVELGRCAQGRVVVQASLTPSSVVGFDGATTAFRRMLVEDETFIPLAPHQAMTFGASATINANDPEAVEEFLLGQYAAVSAPQSLRTRPGAADVFAPVAA